MKIDSAKQNFNHIEIEKRWRKNWDEKGLYKIANNNIKNKYYILPQLPYPSGSGLHVGHAEGYTACDIFARFQRMNKKDVLQVIGWDSFGLPAENYAIKTNIHPKISTEKAIDNFREQIKALGISVDWSREVGSHNPNYYKWTQWFFLLMYKKGLAYRKSQNVNWCDNCKTVLANEQVIEGKCERCGSIVKQRFMKQWFLKITAYAERLLKDLDKIDWPEESKNRQRNWIGKSEGAEINFNVFANKEPLETLKVFTTAHDTIFGATFIVIAPENKILQKLKKHIKNWDEIEGYIIQSKKKTELQRQQQKEKTGIKVFGLLAKNPATDQKIPIYIADYVLSGYGTGAIMAVPAHDERDHEFALANKLPIVSVVKSKKFVSYTKDIKPNLSKYTVDNSQKFSGLNFDKARKLILQMLVKNGVAKVKTQYKLRDWSISRQRFWGAPIPIVFDPEGKIHPVKMDDLPVRLPDDVDFIPTGRSPLTYSKVFQKGVEEKYGKGWKREVDTLDTFMCSSWYYFRYIDPHNNKEFASKKALKQWMPVDFYIGGPEHVNGHLLYSRFFTKVLFDEGIIDFDEPFPFHRHQGLILGEDGRKMSKRWGNVINPLDVIIKYGADTTRMYEMFMGPLEQDKSWSESSVMGVRRFIQRIYNFQSLVVNKPSFSNNNIDPETHKLIKKVTESTQKLKFNVAVSDFMKALNRFEKNINKVSKKDWEIFLLLLAPYAPFVSEELWSKLGKTKSIHKSIWPKFDSSLVLEKNVEIAIQINGKLRDTILIPIDTNQDTVTSKALESEKIQKHLADKDVKKLIYVPNKIINIVV